MSSSFSANQYDGAFKSQRLQNWCQTKPVKERPRAHLGHTTFLADNRGHLLPGVKKGSAWPDFKGTWDLPARIPAHHINTTARSAEGLDRLQLWGLSPPQQHKSVSQRGRRSIDTDKQTSETSESRVSQRHEVWSSAEQALQTTQQDKPKCATEENQSSTHTAGDETLNRPETTRGRPQSSRGSSYINLQAHRDCQLDH
ncbi:protein Flattop isoform X2 [Fundulus heteroclitus]|uniref:protein Flattop isoform X2 n=1 Tax=Fundulus heteroclitus TaxID=8078 RepID=UPI00165B2203|nr:protein Flattop isoform X2 [Fundulus heteroclitus]